MLDIKETDTVASSSNRAVAVDAADFDRDGDLDLVTANDTSSDLAVFVNNGQAQFTHGGSVSVYPSYEPSAVVAADLDNDYYLDADLAVAAQGANSLVLVWNTYTSPPFFYGQTAIYLGSLGGTQPVALAAADFNLDGRMDLAVANYASKNVLVFQNTYPYSGFVHVRTLSLIGNATGLVAANLDADTDADLAVTERTSATSPGNVTVFLNTGSFNFTGTGSYTAGLEPRSVSAADLDLAAGGLLDLAVANQGSNSVSILGNQGSGIFTLKATSFVGTAPRSVILTGKNSTGAVVPLLIIGTDGHNLPDMAVANETTGSLSVRINRGGWLFTSLDTSNSLLEIMRSDLPLDRATPRALVAGKFNSDPNTFMDVAVAFGTNPAAVGVLKGQYTGSGETPFQYFVTGPEPYESKRDGSLDKSLVAHEHSHGVIWRLVGGQNPLPGLQGNAFSEGMADFFSLALTQTSAAEKPRGMWPYLKAEPPDGVGARSMHYSASGPLTYKDYNSRRISQLALLGSEHGKGEIWAGALWALYWRLCDSAEYGRGNNLYLSGMDPAAKGENVALQLAIDALKLMPVEASFLTARNMILLADRVDYGGRNLNVIWEVFASKGMGWSACDSYVAPNCVSFDPDPDPPLPPENDVKEATDLPPLGSISGTVFNDLNGDGDLDLEYGESGNSNGWTVFLDLNQNGQLDPTEDNAEFKRTTDANGFYSFSQL